MGKKKQKQNPIFVRNLVLSVIGLSMVLALILTGNAQDGILLFPSLCALWMHSGRTCGNPSLLSGLKQEAFDTSEKNKSIPEKTT